LLVCAILPTLNANWADLLNILRWPFACAFVTAMMTLICNDVLQGISPIPRLIADMAVAGLTLFVFIRLFGKKILEGAHGDYLLANGRLPASFRRLLGL